MPPQQLWNERGGDLEFEYDHDTYWPALVKLCHEKHTEQFERWVKAGKRYGESELYLRGGSARSLDQGSQEAVKTSEKSKEERLPEVSDESSAALAPIQIQEHTA